MTTGRCNLNQEKDSQRYAQEATLTTKVKKYLDSVDDLFYWKASERFIKGVSDIIAVVNGITVAIELKADKGKASPHQLLFIRNVEKAGGIGGVCYTVAEVKKLISTALCRK